MMTKDVLTQSLQQELDVKTTSLACRALIEASAGTGKTYSLKHLVLRLLIEGETPVTIDRLLLVTFTKAATGELSQRIRSELQALADRLLTGRAGTDETLEQQIALWIDGGLDVDTMLARVQNALSNFDDARVYTIHGFCQRMLKENVFSSGSDYGYRLEDTDDLVRQTVDEFLRAQLKLNRSPEFVETLFSMKGWEDKLKSLVLVPESMPKAIVDEDETYRKVLEEFVLWAPKRLSDLKRDGRVIGYDDLLKLMNDAVRESDDFVRSVRGQFDAVMIDEFQDTDATQYSIFKRLFLDESIAPELLPKTVFFVGDPKQAIYRFRHAELETYLEAKNDIGMTYSLSRNFRSTGGLIACINGFFNSENAFFTPEIQYQDIRFDPKKPPLIERCSDGRKRVIPAFEVWSDSKADPCTLDAVDDIRSFEAQCIARDIDYLLTHEVYIGSRRVQPADIAILVRQRKHADSVIDELRKRNVRTLVRSQQDVFKTQEAKDILAVLRAMESPHRMSALACARATNLMGQTLKDFVEGHDGMLSARVLINETIELYGRLGLTAAFRHLMRACRVNERLLGTQRGDRRLRNYSHVLECLHTQSMGLKTLSGLTRWFEKAVKDKGETPDERKVRLESEDNLVTVETIHGSKGLEYPIVYLCHASDSAKASSSKKQTVFKVRLDGEMTLLMSAQELYEKSIEANALAVESENARIGYVAMTRASCRLVLPLIQKRGVKGPLTVTHRSVYRGILGGAIEAPESTFDQGMMRVRAALNAQSQSLQESLGTWMDDLQGDEYRELFALKSWSELKEENDATGDEEAASEIAAILPDYGCDEAKAVRESWRQTSFSALVKDSYVPSTGHERDGGEDEANDMLEPSEEAPSLRGDILDIRGGKEVGTCLHKLFEEADFASIERMSDDDLARFVDRVLRRYPTVYGQGEQAANCLAACCKLLKDVLTCRLPAPMGWRLCDVQTKYKRNEMPFLISLGDTAGRALSAKDLARALKRLDPRYEMGELTEGRLQGYLTGVIDLMCCHNGKFWVIDWKGNRLGTQLSDYTADAIENEMHRHHYRLQYLLYLVALLRFLRDRLGCDDVYDKIGGACYVFLRAVRPEGQSDAFVFDRPSRAVLECLDRLLERGYDEDLIEAACRRDESEAKQ